MFYKKILAYLLYWKFEVSKYFSVFKNEYSTRMINCLREKSLTPSGCNCDDRDGNIPLLIWFWGI